MDHNISNNDLTKELIDRFIFPVWNDRDLSVIDRYISKNAEIRTTFIAGNGPEILKKSIEETFAAFPVFKLKLEEIIQQDNRVTYKWSAYAEHQGNILNIKPSNKGMSFHGIVFGELENGQITKYHSFSNIPQTLYSSLEQSTPEPCLQKTVLLSHENYEKEISDLIFSIVKTTGVRLSRRELECLYFWVKGYSIKETARQLGDVSVKTIQVFRDKIKKKFGISSYRLLVDFLQKNGMLTYFL